jgi:hypothetical protein
MQQGKDPGKGSTELKSGDSVVMTTDAARLGEYWNQKLSGNLLSADGKFKRKYPLAPVDLEEMGLVNDENYPAENYNWGSACTQYMLNELRLLSQEPDFLRSQKGRGNIEIAGCGLGRDLGFTRKAVENLMLWCTIRDVSQKALENAHRFIDEAGTQPIIRNQDPHATQSYALFQQEILSAWKSGEVNGHNALGIHASGFLQVQPAARMEEILWYWGSILRYPYRRIWIIHPFPNDNDSPVEWNGLKLPKPKWGDTTPFESREFVRSAQIALSRSYKVQLIRPQKIKYFHQTYTACTMVAI